MGEAGHATSDRERRIRGVIIALTIIVLAIATAAAARKFARDQSALLRWRGQLLDLPRGIDIYEPAAYPDIPPYPNPPFAGLLLWPFAKLPPLAGAMALYTLKAALAGLAIAWAIRLAAAGRRWSVDAALPAAAMGLVLLLCARPVLSDLQHGNINIIVLFLVMAGLTLLARGRDFGAGVVIGLAAAVKVTPGLFGLYFLCKRQWRAAAGMFAGGLIGVAAPMPVLGIVHTIDLHVAWFDQIVRPYAMETDLEYTGHMNQSLPGVFFRLFTDSPGVDRGDELGAESINIASLDPVVAKGIVAGLIAALLVTLAWLCRLRAFPSTDRDWRLACEWSLALIVMLLISERSWKHHYVIMALPFAVMVAHLWLGAPPRWPRRALWGAIGLALVVMLGMSGETIGWVYHGVGHKYVEAMGSYFWMAVTSIVAIAMILRQK